MPDIGGVQLLPTQKRRFGVAGVSGGNDFLVFACAFIAALIITFIFLSYRTSKTMKSIISVDTELQTIQTVRDKPTENKLLDLQRQLATTNTLLTDHLRWSMALSKLNQIIQPDVVLETLSGDAGSKTLRFSAEADAYDAVAKQVAAFYQDKDFTEVKLNQVQTKTNGGVTFSMDLTFDPALFLKTKQQ